jgi:hypothetical protein
MFLNRVFTYNSKAFVTVNAEFKVFKISTILCSELFEILIFEVPKMWYKNETSFKGHDIFYSFEVFVTCNTSFKNSCRVLQCYRDLKKMIFQKLDFP